jgi:2-oxoglutarate ferredoxin oxidoreductase subunit beta
MAELLAVVSPESYIERTSVHDVKHILATKKAIREAFMTQIQDIGFSLVEVLSACPTNWRLDPVRCMKRIEAEVMPYYPLGTFSRPMRRAQ